MTSASSRALWTSTGFVSTSLCPQKALSPVRTRCPSRSPVPARRPRTSPQECGPGPGSGQQDSQGGYTMESLAREGGHLRLHHPARPQLPCLGTQHPPHSLAAGAAEGHKGSVCWGRGHRAQAPESRGAWGRSGIGGGEQRSPKLNLTDLLIKKKKRSAKPRRTLPLTHPPTTVIPNTHAQIFHNGSSEDRKHHFISGPIPSQPTVLQRTP